MQFAQDSAFLERALEEEWSVQIRRELVETYSWGEGPGHE